MTWQGNFIEMRERFSKSSLPLRYSLRLSCETENMLTSASKDCGSDKFGPGSNQSPDKHAPHKAGKSCAVYYYLRQLFQPQLSYPDKIIIVTPSSVPIPALCVSCFDIIACTSSLGNDCILSRFFSFILTRKNSLLYTTSVV